MSAAATDERHRALGLTGGEYDRIVELLGREPGDTELAMLSLMWSEHCAYKHSKKLLRRLPTDGPHVLMGPGENAGVVDVGGGLALAFKVESHNHPSAVEPFEGAATGVGGILRDVFAVGARPIAVLDSLRFGEPEGSERSRYLLEHAVAGIGHYGNSIGVPTVGGEIYFESSYEQNCLVNAMCLGLAPHERLIRAAAAGPGNVLILFGALTGRDGIGGASVLASAELGDGDEAKRPSVQIGDPFAEKKLLECCLELLDADLLVSLQGEYLQSTPPPAIAIYTVKVTAALAVDGSWTGTGVFTNGSHVYNDAKVINVTDRVAPRTGSARQEYPVSAN